MDSSLRMILRRRLSTLSSISRIVELPREIDEDGKERRVVILLEEIIERNMPSLFLNYDIVASHPFRIMRNADLIYLPGKLHNSGNHRGNLHHGKFQLLILSALFPQKRSDIQRLVPYQREGSG